MRVVTIGGDDRTVTALKLLGIEGYAVKSPGDAVKLINSFLEDPPDVAGIFISSSIMDGIRDYVDKVKERRRTPPC